MWTYTGSGTNIDYNIFNTFSYKHLSHRKYGEKRKGRPLLFSHSYGGSDKDFDGKLKNVILRINPKI